MDIIKTIKNIFGMAEEDKDLVTLITEGSIEKAKYKFTNRQEIVKQALLEYNIAGHKIMERPDKALIKGDIVTSWNIPISYQKKIVQSAVAFLYGKPVKLIQQSENTDNAFKALLDLRKEMRMAAKDQKCAEITMSETECVKLFVPYRDANADKTDLTKANSVKCILLAKSLGDIVHVSFDSFGVLRAIGREYSVSVSGKKIEHFDVYMADFTYYCDRTGGSWNVRPEVNVIGKIAAVWYMQPESEWAIVQIPIERREYLTSARADNVDRTGDPILVLEGGKPISLPDAKATGKVVVLPVGGKASYLVPQMSTDMVKDEKEDLKELIHYLTDTADLSMKTTATLGQDSGKALEMKYFGPILKAMSRHGYYEEMHDRENEVLKAFISKVIDPSSAMEAEIKNLQVGIEFGNPLPDNTGDLIDMLSSAVGGKPIMSQKTAVELNPLVKDADAENALLKGEELSTIVE
jgi:SPP1 family phage portal protein